VFFEVTDDVIWPLAPRNVLASRRPLVVEALLWMAIVLAFAAAAVLARWNLRAGDRSVAGRLAVFTACGGVVFALLRGHHVPAALEEITYLLGVSGWALVWAGFAWLVYVGLAPRQCGDRPRAAPRVRQSDRQIMMTFHRTLSLFCLAAGVALCVAVPFAQPQGTATALVGGTVIDGNGGAPITDAVVVVTGSRITAVGPRTSVPIPADANQVDARGRWIVPGLIDTNVHLSLYGGQNDRYESLVRYQPRQREIVLEAAQIDLSYGVTTVRDSYGALIPLTEVRDAINRGEKIGARILAAGNILGWSGPYSFSFSRVTSPLTLFQEQMNDYIAQDAGEELMAMTPDELRRALNKYVDKGPDFIKYGATSHFAEPTFIGFSVEAQQALVEEAKRRGRFVEIHATSVEGLRVALAAGVDGIQHPELLDGRDLPDDIVALLRERGIVCSMLTSTITGPAWQRHLKSRDEAVKKREEAEKSGRGIQREKTSAERRKEDSDMGAGLEARRRNAQKLIRGGALVTPGTDSYWAAAPELTRTPKFEEQDHGIGTIMAIEGLVELGMTPAQAIVAGTRNGATASRRLADFGTIEAGKLADLVVLAADPLAEIKNIRKVEMVFKDGRAVDRTRLPEARVLSVAPSASKAGTGPAGK
jgi:imidazolonepropionase-like amidohydrolase